MIRFKEVSVLQYLLGNQTSKDKLDLVSFLLLIPLYLVFVCCLRQGLGIGSEHNHLINTLLIVFIYL